VSALEKEVTVPPLELRSTQTGVTRRVDLSTTDGELDRTIAGPSTVLLTIHDPRRKLLDDPMFIRRKDGGLGYVDLQLDGIWWRLVKFEKQGDDLSLTFEDRAVAYLRRYWRPMKAKRGDVTRAEFVLALVRQVKEGGGIGFYCPELHVVQQVAPIATKRGAKKTAQQKADERLPGIPLSSDPRSHLSVKGAAATIPQIKNANTVLDVARSCKAGHIARLALVEACIVESRLGNPSAAQSDKSAGASDPSAGILQVLRSTAQAQGIDPRDVAACANRFLLNGFYSGTRMGAGGAIDKARRFPAASAGEIAQAVQGSAYPSRYDEWKGEAQAFLDSYDYGSAASSSTSVSKTKALPYEFWRGSKDGSTKEDSWAAIQRLAGDVNWRAFCDRNVVYFVSDDTLMQAAPVMILNERTLGVDSIDFDVDDGKVNLSATVVVRADRWAAGPGTVVELRDCGPANGRWLVETIRRPLFDPRLELTLTAPGIAALEPAPSTTTTTTSVPAGSTSGRQNAYVKGSPAWKAYRAAWAMHDKHFPYVWGGGHAKCGTPDGGVRGGEGGGIGLTGYDCSGSTGAVLAAAGWGFQFGRPVEGSGRMATSWGLDGTGPEITMYANETHVFLVFHNPTGDGSDLHFGTGDYGKGWDGPGFNPDMHPTSGFGSRHWPVSGEKRTSTYVGLR
jgi:hypothetical protein